MLYDDHPTAWDAWDVDPQHMETEAPCPPAESCRISSNGSDPRAEIAFDVEHGFGVALLSESKYGFSTFGNVMRMSLLRSPKHRDPHADMGKDTFCYAILPHAGGWRDAGVVAEAYRFSPPASNSGPAAASLRSSPRHRG